MPDPQSKRGRIPLLLKLAVGAVLVAAFGFLFMQSLRDTRAAAYTIDQRGADAPAHGAPPRQRARQVFFVLFDAPSITQFRQQLGLDPAALPPVLFVAGDGPDFNRWLPQPVDTHADCLAPVETVAALIPWPGGLSDDSPPVQLLLSSNARFHESQTHVEARQDDRQRPPEDRFRKEAARAGR